MASVGTRMGQTAEQIIADVLQTHFDFGTVGLPQPLEMAHQRRHRKLVVATDRGKFLIKTYKNDPVILDVLRFQHRLSEHLDQNGLPVARIQRSKTGQKIIERDSWALEVQEFIEGASMRVNPATLEISADVLGRFHVVCRDFPCPHRDSRMWRFSIVPREPFAALFERAKAEGDEHEAVDACNRLALFLRDASKELSLEARSRFETGLIHGDWHGGNLLFQGNELKAIIDLEFVGDGCYLEDLAYGISNLCVRTSTDPHKLETRTLAVLNPYQRHRTLSFHEEAALYFAVGVKHIATVSYQIQQKGQVAGCGAADWMKRLAVQCDWLGKQAHHIRFG
jgi:Ser/Thr protein kinase RdoA (MazF antagonist)